MTLQSTPVLIIGAGPTGLTLANLLSSYGIAHRLVEHKTEALHTSNALAIQPRSLEVLDSLGLADAAIARGKKIVGLSLNSTTQPIGEINLTNVGLQTQFPFILGLPQNETETLLTEHLIKQGGKIERGCTLLSMTQTDKAVIAQLQNANGEQESIACNWLIAADGSHSAVRKNLNLDFIGATIPEKFIMMDAEISADLNPDFFHATLSPLGPLVFAPMRHFSRIICTVTHDTGIADFKNPTLADFEYVIKKRSHLSVNIIKTIWLSHFMTHHRLIDNYRHGRILFAGDSAHIHSPVGGQGMNTGMQDAFNLAWKLALVCKKHSANHLLDTYHIERREIAKKVLSSTTRMTQFVALKNPLLISFRNAMLGCILKINALKKAFATQISGISIRYPINHIIINNGKRAPDALLIDQQNNTLSLRKLFCGLKYKVLIFTGNTISEESIQIITTLNQWVKNTANDLFEVIIISAIRHDFNDFIVYFDDSGLAHKAYALEQGGICLVRPDQYIGLCHPQIDYCPIKQYAELVFLKSISKVV